MPDRPHIVFAEPFDDSAVQKARAVGRVTLLDNCSEETLKHAVSDADALLVRTASKVTRAVIKKGQHLRVIGRGGVGLDSIDVQAAKEQGITVVHTPYAATDAVADLAVGLMLNLLRMVNESDAAVRAGSFAEARAQNVGRELGELTLGIVGFGRIGSAVARRCQHGFGMRVLYNDIVQFADVTVEARSKEQLFAESDIISLHVPLTPQTDRMIDQPALTHFRPGAMLINTARGRVVDNQAVAMALHAGVLSGAAFDVLDLEPPPPDHPLLRAPNTIITPHIGARTHGGLARMDGVIDDVLRVLRGEQPECSA
jgi:phosphoglycerate dehydrogenase-like enzyme